MTLECNMPKISYGLIIANHRLRKMMSSEITNLEYAQNTKLFLGWVHFQTTQCGHVQLEIYILAQDLKSILPIFPSFLRDCMLSMIRLELLKCIFSSGYSGLEILYSALYYIMIYNEDKVQLQNSIHHRLKTDRFSQILGSMIIWVMLFP